MKDLVDQNPQNVVNSIIFALTSVFPLRAYYPNWQATIILRVFRFMPYFLGDRTKYNKYFKFFETTPLIKNKSSK